jgi:small subunit ribosomal protein S17
VPEKKTAAKKTTATKATATKPTARKTVARRAPAKAAAVEAAAPAAALTAAAVTAEIKVHRGHRRSKVGKVVSAKTRNTAIVEVERQRQHPLYKKVIRVRKRFPAHDATGDVKAGDLVRIQESRPFSATKRWQVIEVLSRAGEAGAAARRVADVERELEETEGVTELLAKPERVAAEASAEEAEDATDVSERTGDDR